eukprot:jgi/Mesvir1/7349/Mv19157-RA.1
MSALVVVTRNNPEFAKKMPAWWVEFAGGTAATEKSTETEKAPADSKTAEEIALMKKQREETVKAGVQEAVDSLAAIDLVWKKALSTAIENRLNRLRESRDSMKRGSESRADENDKVNVLKAQKDALILQFSTDVRKDPVLVLSDLFLTLIPEVVEVSQDAIKDAALKPSDFFRTKVNEYEFVDYILEIY